MRTLALALTALITMACTEAPRPQPGKPMADVSQPPNDNPNGPIITVIEAGMDVQEDGLMILTDKGNFDAPRGTLHVQFFGPQINTDGMSPNNFFFVFDGGRVDFDQLFMALTRYPASSKIELSFDVFDPFFTNSKHELTGQPVERRVRLCAAIFPNLPPYVVCVRKPGLILRLPGQAQQAVRNAEDRREMVQKLLAEREQQ